MKILHVLSSDDGYGSAQCFKELLKYEIGKSDVVPVVLTPKHNLINEYCNLLGVANYSVKYGQVQIPKHDNVLVFFIKYLCHFIKYYLLLKSAKQEICKIIEQQRVDVVHTNTCVIDIGARCSAMMGVPHVWHLREFGRDDFNFYPVRFCMIRWMNNTKSRYIAVSKAVKNEWARKGINPNLITVLYDGVDATKFIYDRTQFANDKINIVMTGSFCEAKGQLLLVKAIKKLGSKMDSVEVSFFGKTEGRYYNKVKRFVIKNKLENIVHFKGYSESIPEELSKSQIGVLCSRAEAFGRVTVEYMLSGLCTIATSSGANFELIEENGCGLLYDVNNSSSLSKCIEYVLSKTDIIQDIGCRAKVIAEKKYDINKNVKNILDFFSKQIG